MLISSKTLLSKKSIKRFYAEKLASGYPSQLIEFEQSILLKNVEKLSKIWPFLSIDLIRNHISFLEIINIPLDKKNSDWLQQNIKLESFLHMLNHHYTKVGCIEINTFISDTLSQLTKLLKKNVAVKCPKRWRLIEFHDYVSYLYLTNNTKNSKLKTKINPYKKGEYTLSQPKDTVSIIIWGKKVKNCVASYEDRIGKSLWIFFLEKDGVPFYTIETDMKKYHVGQMVRQCNASVNSQEREFAQKMILEAVKNSPTSQQNNE